MISRNIFSVRENFSFFHTVWSKWKQKLQLATKIRNKALFPQRFTTAVVFSLSQTMKFCVPFLKAAFLTFRGLKLDLRLDSFKYLFHLDSFVVHSAVWKFLVFAVTRILRETKFREFRSSKTAFFFNPRELRILLIC